VPIALAAAVAVGLPAWTQAADQPATVNAGVAGIPAATGTLQTAVLSGGCFWGTQGVFEHVKGVRKVLAGYSGGDRSTADYESVSTGRISLGDLLCRRVAAEDRTGVYRPTGAGPRVRPPDRHTRGSTERVLSREGYHQDFLVRNPRYPYIVYNDLPKIANLKRELPEIYVDQPVLTAAAH
jgi:peptide-methionine (S)-S-oxide reductase